MASKTKDAEKKVNPLEIGISGESEDDVFVLAAEKHGASDEGLTRVSEASDNNNLEGFEMVAKRNEFDASGFEEVAEEPQANPKFFDQFSKPGRVNLEFGESGKVTKNDFPDIEDQSLFVTIDDASMGITDAVKEYKTKNKRDKSSKAGKDMEAKGMAKPKKQKNSTGRGGRDMRR